jgi:hypothetical protein
MAPGPTPATRRNRAQQDVNGGQSSHQTWARNKFRDLAFHFLRRVDRRHNFSSYSHLFRYAEQVRTTVSEGI